MKTYASRNEEGNKIIYVSSEDIVMPKTHLANLTKENGSLSIQIDNTQADSTIGKRPMSKFLRAEDYCSIRLEDKQTWQESLKRGMRK